MIQTSLSIGIILGGLLAPIFIDIWSLKQVLLSKIGALTVLFILFSLTWNFYIAILIYFCIGVGITAWTLAVTALQMRVDLDFQARVQATSNSLAAIVILLVYFLLH